MTLASALKAAEALDAELVVFGQFKLEPDASPTQSKVEVNIRLAGRKASQAIDLRESGTLANLSTLENFFAKFKTNNCLGEHYGSEYPTLGSHSFASSI